jgi:DNA/RNA-binding domain of Phe-tRNA-synthetase-like protein
MEKHFQYHPEILKDFPSVVGGLIVAGDLVSDSMPQEFSNSYLSEQKRLLSTYKDQPLSQIPAIYAWRRAFRKFGTNPTKYRCAAEALLRRLTKKGDIPQINLLVDIANLVSIRYALPVAVFDTRALTSPLTVHYADGTESFTPLSSSHPEKPQLGEVVFSDERKAVAARRWCWRQSADSAANQRTENAIITVESLHPGGEVDVKSAVEDLLHLMTKYASGKCTHAILGATSPS